MPAVAICSTLERFNERRTRGDNYCVLMEGTVFVPVCKNEATGLYERVSNSVGSNDSAQQSTAFHLVIRLHKK